MPVLCLSCAQWCDDRGGWHSSAGGLRQALWDRVNLSSNFEDVGESPGEESRGMEERGSREGQKDYSKEKGGISSDIKGKNGDCNCAT